MGSPIQSYAVGGGYYPWNTSTYTSPSAPLPDDRLITSDPGSYVPPYPWSGEPPSDHEPPSLSILKGGLDPKSYGPAPLAPRYPNSGPGTGGENSDRVPRSQSPSRMNGLPDSGSSIFSDFLRRLPLYGYGTSANGSLDATTPLTSLLAAQPLSLASMSPSVRPPQNAASSAAFATSGDDAWPLPGTGILSGLRPELSGAGKGILSGLTQPDGWPLLGNGILSGLTLDPAGGSGSGGSEGGHDPSWAQILHEMWMRRTQDDSYADDGNR